ncbi:MAG: hypothetical protein OES99_01365, partial [Gammaproteobacteria bacterium]|nr:hypothetical protein [Gammaproteobacteria bacterium]
MQVSDAVSKLVQIAVIDKHIVGAGEASGAANLGIKHSPGTGFSLTISPNQTFRLRLWQTVNHKNPVYQIA